MCSASLLVIYQCQPPFLRMSAGPGAHLRAPAVPVKGGSSAALPSAVRMSAATPMRAFVSEAFHERFLLPFA